MLTRSWIENKKVSGFRGNHGYISYILLDKYQILSLNFSQVDYIESLPGNSTVYGIAYSILTCQNVI